MGTLKACIPQREKAFHLNDNNYGFGKRECQSFEFRPKSNVT